MVDFGKLLEHDRAKRQGRACTVRDCVACAVDRRDMIRRISQGEHMANGDDGSGFGLDDFLGYDPDKEKRRFTEFLDWDNEVLVWLATRARIHAVWNHQFIVEDEVEEKDRKGERTGRMKLINRWPRFVSPDSAKVHANQFFRESNGQLQEPPEYDRFLLLREWLRARADRGDLKYEDLVFEWTDHKSATNELIQWTVGEASDLEKRGKANRGHNLNTKLDYIFLVVEHEKPEAGIVIARETKLLGDRMRKAIKQRMASVGSEKGNPFTSPVAFKWAYDARAKTPMESYDAFVIEQAECTDAIWNAIDAEQVPDVSQHVTVGDDDVTKIRAAFESAAQIDLPLDLLFEGVSDEKEHARAVAALLAGDAGKAQPARRPATPPSQPGATKPGGAQRPPATRAPATAPATGGRRPVDQPPAQPPPAAGGRRRMVAAPQPPPEPEPPPVEETIPCDNCQEPMAPDATKCEACGAEYQVEPDADAPPPAPPTPASSSGARRPPTTSGAAKPSGASRPSTGQPAPAAATRRPDAPTATPSGARRPGTGGRRAPATPPPEAGGENDDDGEGGDDHGIGAGDPPPEDPHPIETECWACGSDDLRVRDDQKTVCGNCNVEQSDKLPF